MGLIVPTPGPTVVTLRKGPDGKPRHAVYLNLGWSTDPGITSQTQVGGYNFENANSYLFNPLSIGGLPVELGALKSLRFTETFFQNSGNTNPDGAFLIYCPNDGALHTYNQPFLNEDSFFSVTGLIPIEVTSGGHILFAKQSDPVTTDNCNGSLSVVLYDFEVAPLAPYGCITSFE
jgi:hypothetical protein